MDPTCIASLRAFADGRLREWHGLPHNCQREDAESALGPGPLAPDGVSSLGGSLSAFRIYPPTESSPFGVQVWLNGDSLWALEVNSPRLPEPALQSLGEPETKGQSGIGSSYDHWIYHQRGLALHIHRITGAVVRIYGFPTMSLEQFRQSPFAHVESRRIPLRHREAR